MRRLSIVAVCLFMLAPLPTNSSTVSRAADVAIDAPAGDGIDFEQDVLPILRARCVECHGPVAQESGLRVDSRQALLAGGDVGPAVVPGEPTKTEILRRMATTDPDERMPPEGEPLTAAEIAAVSRWVAGGAIWPGQMEAAASVSRTSDHWAFQPLTESFAHDSIDFFLAAELAARGLAPSPPADRRTLIRRLFLDLTGLPPTPDEVEAFVADASPRAIEALIDRLLASPRYGERWSQHWPDVSRYADTRGYEYNTLRDHAWPYRDWVIDALNRDLPYDRFLFQQLAGDTVGVDAATGFLVTAPLPTPPEVGEEPAAIRQARLNSLDEVVQNVGAAVLGLTVGCARCHNHKFDPISSRDYYRMTAVFSGVHYDDRPWRRDNDADRVAQIRDIEQAIEAVRGELAGFPQWRSVDQGRFSDHFQPVTTQRIRLNVIATDATSEGPAFDELEVWGTSMPDQAATALPATNLAAAMLGGKASSSGAAKQVGGDDEVLNDGKYGKESTWVADRRPPAWVQIDLPHPARIDRVTWSRDRHLAEQRSPDHASRLTSRWAIEVDDGKGGWRTVVDATRSSGIDAETAERRRECEAKLAELQRAAFQPRVVFAGRFTSPDPVHLLLRGDPAQPTVPVGPGGLEVLRGVELAGDTPEPDRRVALARWLVGDAAPLVARAIVNRVWHHHFGTGLVSTTSDFGISGERPSHPALLDWLARRFIDHGWSLKSLHRDIVTSAAYRQASSPVAAAVAVDPDSRLLWRYPPQRLDAESIHDAMLSAAGVLDLVMGGPGVITYHPKVRQFDEWRPLEDPGPAAWRRMIYLAKMRGTDDGMFKVFDLPDCGQVRDKRGESTTPLQALNLMNGPFTLRMAEKLSTRLRREAGDEPSAQIDRLFAILFSRPPLPAERHACIDTLRSEGLETVCIAAFNSNEFLVRP
ncbi:MAG: PSD1 and planctomycete cytochrome C domain-containing protein [Planctomycetota bacterium]|nr:PSD1 and planctomycete cytochrome C domain-containing protein [Planctomycetota bacterium]